MELTNLEFEAIKEAVVDSGLNVNQLSDLLYTIGELTDDESVVDLADVIERG